AHAITTDAWRNSLDHYQEFVIIVALDLKIEVIFLIRLNILYCIEPASHCLGDERCKFQCY
ncbi:hypothetical protein, partial [Lacticaseibacillus paracasei]|uniref:hypothetical protein n=1 Tax=Lacticaseibacillus paracasei TaxID=1597 RepID=UPI0021AB0685